MADAIAGRIHRRVGTLVDEVAERLATASIPLAREEARDLVAALLDVPRFWPALNRESETDEYTCRRVLAAALRRASGAPFAYAVGRAAFRHLTLDVDERVLIPRQETEQLVDVVLAAGLPSGGVAIDVGTGSGAIAIALATEAYFERVIGTDVSLDALDVARRNASLFRDALRAPIDFRHGSLLAPLRGTRARLVVSNPPYIAHREVRLLPRSVRDWEPPLALFAEDDGNAITAALVGEAAGVLEPGGLLALETDARRAAAVAGLVSRHGAYRDVTIRRDLTGRDRFVLGWRQRCDPSDASDAD